MTQGIYQFPQEHHLNSIEDRLPPCNIEAEEAILGGLLIDPHAIDRIKHRLKPEHFYVTAHKDIYQSCLKLSNQGEPTDLIAVTSWLADHGILTRVGGRNKLASVTNKTVHATNIDQLAKLVIDKAILRDVIKVGEEIRRLGYSTEMDIPEIMHLLSNKTKSIFDTPAYKTKEEKQRSVHDRVLKELTDIYTTCEQATLRLLKVKDLSDESHISMKLLELIYLKSLAEQCSKLLTYEELKELAGSTVREWLINGLVPKSTTILLAADGGLGKTKLAYGIGKVLIQGGRFGQFNTTGEKRRILYYQGDESPGDMLEALEILGYSEDDISKYVRVRFGWSGENIPTLLHDLKEFKPELVFIDSLSTANRYSVYKESEMEYARPILELTGLASQYNATFVIIHHTNKEGGVRGTTAIRNAVSEVWTLSKDTSNTATPYDRILEINKSRSRSSGKKYRMMFDPSDLSFTFLAEESEQGFNLAEQSAKEQLLDFFCANRNIKFTNEELAHKTGYSSGHLRNCLTGLAADGLVSVERRPGKSNLYFLVRESTGADKLVNSYTCGTVIDPNTSDHLRSPLDHLDDHLYNPYTVTDTAKGDRPIAENRKKNQAAPPPQSQKKSENRRSADQLRLDALPDNSPGGDRTGDRRGDRGVIGGDRPGDRSPLGYEEVKVGDSIGITSHPTRIDAVGSVEKISSVVNGCFKTESGIQLSKGEFEKVASPEVTPPAPKAITADNASLPLIQEKAVYWSQSFKQEIKVSLITDDLSEVCCRIPGKGTFSLPFTDLQACQQSPRHNLKVGDQVVILVGKHSETFAWITSINYPQGIYLKSDEGKYLKKAYFPHQLVRV